MTDDKHAPSEPPKPVRPPAQPLFKGRPNAFAVAELTGQPMPPIDSATPPHLVKRMTEQAKAWHPKKRGKER